MFWMHVSGWQSLPSSSWEKKDQGWTCHLSITFLAGFQAILKFKKRRRESEVKVVSWVKKKMHKCLTSWHRRVLCFLSFFLLSPSLFPSRGWRRHPEDSLSLSFLQFSNCVIHQKYRNVNLSLSQKSRLHSRLGWDVRLTDKNANYTFLQQELSADVTLFYESNALTLDAMIGWRRIFLSNLTRSKINQNLSNVIRKWR